MSPADVRRGDLRLLRGAGDPARGGLLDVGALAFGAERPRDGVDAVLLGMRTVLRRLVKNAIFTQILRLNA